MEFWAYSRNLHLILLLSVIILYGLFYASAYYFWECELGMDYSLMRMDEWFFMAAEAVFLIIWWLRGLAAFASLFPYFHYTTLLAELVVQIAIFCFAAYTQVMFTTETFDSQNINGYLISALGVGVIVLTAFIVLKYGSI